MALFIALAGVIVILAASEILWRTSMIRGESARKFVHICVGSYIAFWPYFMSWQQIQLLCLALFVVVLMSLKGYIYEILGYIKKHLNSGWLRNIVNDAQNFFRFRSIHSSVDRKTWGELCFPVGIGISALIMPSPVVFTAAILHLALADGLAAVIGKQYGVLHRYKIRNYSKSLAGTLMFFFVSLIIVTGAVLGSGTVITWPLVPLLVWLPAAATMVENVSIAGTDNIFVPLLIIVVLQTVIT